MAKQLKPGAILSGVRTDRNSGRHTELPGDASIGIDWYGTNARKAEATNRHALARRRAEAVPQEESRTPVPA